MLLPLFNLKVIWLEVLLPLRRLFARKYSCHYCVSLDVFSYSKGDDKVTSQNNGFESKVMVTECLVDCITLLTDGCAVFHRSLAGLWNAKYQFIKDMGRIMWPCAVIP